MYEEVQLHAELAKVAEKFGYLSFNDVQVRAFKSIAKGSNVLIVAPTGYGKTEAAVFPIISSILTEGVKEWGVKALYITPLRALNRDIFLRISRLAAEVGVTLEVRHGDTPQSVRKRIVENPPHVLITTPETLQFLLIAPRFREALSSVKWVVVDELHELMQSKRGLQLTLALERLESLVKRRIQRIGLSATINNVIVAGLFLTGYRGFEIIEAKEGRKYMVEVAYIDSRYESEEKMKLLTEIFGKHRNVLIFVNTRDTAEALGVKLRRFFENSIAVHHGSLSKEERISVELGLKNGKLKGVIATSSLELGIDVGSIEYVVQYMSPRQVNRLIQRVGRSFHFRGGIARGCIIASDLDDLAESIVISRRAAHGDLEDSEIEENAYDVLAHQVVGMLLVNDGISLKEVYEVVSKAYPYRNITMQELEKLILFLEGIKVLRFRDGRLFKGARSISYYYEAASTIPDVESFDVVDVAEGKRVGSLDGDFAASTIAEGSRFILGGRVWEVIKLSLDECKVYVTPSGEAEAAIPAWVGEDLPVPYKVAREVGALRRRVLSEPLRRLVSEYGVDEDLLDALKHYVEQQIEAIGVVPSDKEIVIEVSNRFLVVHACIGTKANALLGLLLSFALAKLYGISSKYYFDAYRVVLITPKRIHGEWLVELLTERIDYLLDNAHVAVKGSSAYLWKILHVCQRMGVVRKGSTPKIPARKLAEVFEGSVLEEEVIKELLTTRFDLKILKQLADELKVGAKKICAVQVNAPSPMTENMFEKPYKAGLIAKGSEPLLILKSVRKRLEQSRLLLVCLHCLKWSNVVIVGDVGEEVRCPSCGSKVIAALNPWDEESRKVLKKWRRSEKLTESEMKIVKSAQKSAILVMSYGKKALFCLAGRGVGPVVAARMLSLSKDYDELVREIAKAEADYVRTREFWD
ncbi:MAG: DEAD/DEAH box helicase [Thermofilaceae archaeon]